MSVCLRLAAFLTCLATIANAEEPASYSEITCAFPKDMLGVDLNLREQDDIACVLKIEHTTKTSVVGLGKVLSFGTYAKQKDVPISMSARRLVEYIEADETAFPKNRLGACFDTMHANMMSSKEALAKTLEAQKSETFFLTCAEGSKL